MVGCRWSAGGRGGLLGGFGLRLLGRLLRGVAKGSGGFLDGVR